MDRFRVNDGLDAFRIAAATAGSIERLGTQKEFCERPVNVFVAELIGMPSTILWPASLRAYIDGLTVRFRTKFRPISPVAGIGNACSLPWMIP